MNLKEKLKQILSQIFQRKILLKILILLKYIKTLWRYFSFQVVPSQRFETKYTGSVLNFENISKTKKKSDLKRTYQSLY